MNNISGEGTRGAKVNGNRGIKEMQARIHLWLCKLLQISMLSMSMVEEMAVFPSFSCYWFPVVTNSQPSLQPERVGLLCTLCTSSL